MSKRRKLIVALGAAALAVPFGSYAQQQAKVWRIGYLDFGSRQSNVDAGRYAALIEGLRERGYVEGKNLVLEARYADGNTDRMNEYAAEFVRKKVDLVLTRGEPATRAALRATARIPIVAPVAIDPVRAGYAASLARPGGNVTGLTNGIEDTLEKLVELLIVAAPKLKRIAVLNNPENGAHSSLLSSLQAAARQTGKQILPMSVRTPEEIVNGFAAIGRKRVDAVIILPDVFLFQQRTQIATLVLNNRLPSIYTQAQFPEVGGLMSYGPDVNDNLRRAGSFVDKILKGTKPGEIPFEQPTRYYLVINRKTATALGIKSTNELLARADKIIE